MVFSDGRGGRDIDLTFQALGHCQQNAIRICTALCRMACRPPKEFRPPAEFFRSGSAINRLEVVAVDHLQPAKSSFGAGRGVSRPFAPLRRDFEQNPLKLAGTAEGSRRVLAGLGVRQAHFGREERRVIGRHAVQRMLIRVGSRWRAQPR